MPIYEYECAACGHTLEAIQKMSDAPLKKCPSCHKSKLQKLVSAAGFQLKGTGWYVTDFRNKGKAESKTEKKTTQASDTKQISDSKKSDDKKSSGSSTD